ncbi:MAG TPA: STAS domain-containing protein [Terriglobales bacterium]|nr:STAS domain-containing protein [Terriglobales bacterium]
MLAVDVDRSGDVVVLQCRGRIVRGDATYTLRDAVTSQLNARIIVLDLSQVEALDGSGLGMMVFLHRWTTDNGVQLQLANPSPLVREVLERTRLTNVLHVTSLEEALTILEAPSHNRLWAVAS